ncbi:MAG: hypothetical protein ACKVHP_11615, partial [Verrucomicrobiales bacterium]
MSDMDPGWTGANGASFGIRTGSFAAGGGNTALADDIDFASGTINLETGLQMFVDQLFVPGGGGGPVEPNRGTDDFEIFDATRTTNGVTVSWRSAVGSAYDVEYSTDLTAWTKISDAPIAATGDATSFEDGNAGRTGA